MKNVLRISLQYDKILVYLYQLFYEIWDLILRMLLKKRQLERRKKEKESLLMIDKKSWRNKNCDQDQMSVDEKENFKNLDENLDKNLESVNSMNTKFVNLHVIFFFLI
jgi:short-subunit dehydrogenase involved in D-alanine esterification of teichoic acids